MKSKLLIIFSICVSMLYAEENTYIKQQVAYKDQGTGFSWEEVYESNNCLVPCYIRHKNNCMLVLRTKDDIYPYLAECGYTNNEKNNEIIFSADTFEVSRSVFKELTDFRITQESPWADSVLQNNALEHFINTHGALIIPNISQQEDDYMVAKAFYEGYLFNQDCETGLYVRLLTDDVIDYLVQEAHANAYVHDDTTCTKYALYSYDRTCNNANMYKLAYCLINGMSRESFETLFNNDKPSLNKITVLFQTDECGYPAKIERIEQSRSVDSLLFRQIETILLNSAIRFQFFCGDSGQLTQEQERKLIEIKENTALICIFLQFNILESRIRQDFNVTYEEEKLQCNCTKYDFYKKYIDKYVNR